MVLHLSPRLQAKQQGQLGHARWFVAPGNAKCRPTAHLAPALTTPKWRNATHFIPQIAASRSTEHTLAADQGWRINRLGLPRGEGAEVAARQRKGPPSRRHP
jgi:hypothetical protein